MLELGAELADDGARPDERHLDLAQQRAHLAAAYDPKGARPLALPLQRLAEVRLQRVLAEGRSHAAQLRVAPPLARPLGQGGRDKAEALRV